MLYGFFFFFGLKNRKGAWANELIVLHALDKFVLCLKNTCIFNIRSKFRDFVQF